jgi:hypothetical protein
MPSAQPNVLRHGDNKGASEVLSTIPINAFGFPSLWHNEVRAMSGDTRATVNGHNQNQ